MTDRFDILIFEDIQEEKDRRAKQQTERERRLQKIEDRGKCEGFQGPCPCKEGLSWTYPNTKYPWDKDEDPYDDPNRKLYLCKDCAKGLEEYWAEMWREYYSGRL